MYQDITYLTIGTILCPHPTNGRLTLDETRVDELATSIATAGLLNPISVRLTGRGYELIAGRHRLAACTRLGWQHIAAIVHDANDQQAATIRLVENCVRTQLSPVEEAHGLAALLANEPRGVDALAALTGKSVGWILDRLEIAEWDPELAQAVHERKIPLGAAKRLARIIDPETRRSYIRAAALNGINVRSANMWLAQANGQNETLFETSEKNAQSRTAQFVTETKAYCFCCKNYTKLEETTAVRLCNTCASELAHAQNP